MVPSDLDGSFKLPWPAKSSLHSSVKDLLSAMCQLFQIWEWNNETSGHDLCSHEDYGLGI
jgi:hypothetical protein